MGKSKENKFKPSFEIPEKMDSLVNLRIESAKWKAFKNLCEKEFKMSASEVLRQMIGQTLESYEK